MRTYKINAIQFHVLPVFLKTKQCDMAKRTGISRNKIVRHLQDGNFSLQDALLLCNTYRLNFSNFVSTSEEPCVGTISQCPVELWDDITFCSSKLQGRMRKGLTFAEITDRTGFARTTIDTLVEGRCTVSQLLHACNMLRMNLTDFINDKTLPFIEAGNIREKNRELEEENEKLRKIIERIRHYLPEDIDLNKVAEQ